MGCPNQPGMFGFLGQSQALFRSSSALEPHARPELVFPGKGEDQELLASLKQTGRMTVSFHTIAFKFSQGQSCSLLAYFVDGQRGKHPVPLLSLLLQLSIAENCSLSLYPSFFQGLKVRDGR